jgi:hypothetical protein
MRSHPGITKENAANIHKDMTLLEVEAILGEPGKVAKKRSDWPEETILRWQTDHLEVHVWFRWDDVGRELVAMSVVLPIPMGSSGPTEVYDGPLNRIRRWLKL